jgi:pteridine reductase
VTESAISGRTALVTGAGVRVGRAIALALGRAGCDVAVHFHGSKEPAESVAAEIRAWGRKAEALRADLSDPEACRQLVRAAAAAFGGLDVLVHSAANFLRSPLESADETAWDASMNLNARAAYLLAREAATLLRAARGRVVLISDLLASAPVRGYAAHGVSKAAVEGLVRTLAIELAPEVSVNGVAPGTVLVPEGTPPEVEARWAKEAPLRRNGSAEDVAAAVVFLCSGPSFISGQILGVDGGKSLL